MVVQGVEHPHPIKASPHKLLELRLSGLPPVNAGNGTSTGFLI